MESTDFFNRQVKEGGKTPLYAGHRQRLRERFRKGGLAGFADYEVIEMLLTLAIPRGDTKPSAKALLARFGGLRGVLDAPLVDLQSVKGVGEVAAANLSFVRAVATLYLQEASEGKDVLQDPERLSDFWRAKLGMLKHEAFAVAYVDSARRLLRDGVEVLQEGTIDRAAVYPRRVVESALRRQAAGLILAHNHPNGNVQPSEHDKLITRAIVLAAETVSVRILDHIIVSQQETFSFRKAGLL